MKKITYKQRKEIIKNDTILQNIAKKDKELGRKEQVLFHTRDIKIPKLIQKNQEQMEKLSQRWHKRGAELGLWELDKK